MNTQHVPLNPIPFKMYYDSSTKMPYSSLSCASTLTMGNRTAYLLIVPADVKFGQGDRRLLLKKGAIDFLILVLQKDMMIELLDK